MKGDQVPAAPARRAVAVWAESHRLGLEDLAEVLHLQAHVLRLLLERQWLTWEIADEIAIALGRHPYEIWPRLVRCLSTERPTKPAPTRRNAMTTASYGRQGSGRGHSVGQHRLQDHPPGLRGLRPAPTREREGGS